MALIDIGASGLNAGSLLAEIDNTSGQISGAMAIFFNLSGNATIDGDATFAIYGRDSLGSAEPVSEGDGLAPVAQIGINGGNYDAGGTFLASINQDGAITFDGSSVHADVLKAGVFGSNGTITIGGGGTLSADSTLKLYAPGGNGQINFISDVTLGGSGAKILAANSVTISDDVVVTVGGPAPVDVYTNNANYSGFGGNGTTSGIFDGQGANNPQPLSSAPPFNDPPGGESTTAGAQSTHNGSIPRIVARHGGDGSVQDGAAKGDALHVRNSDELLALLDDAAPNHAGKIVVPRGRNAAGSKNRNGLNEVRVEKRTQLDRDLQRLRDRRQPHVVMAQ